MSQMIVVKKYGNRRLYDTETSSYINLEQLADRIREGHQVQVQDARTRQDLTQEVLLQVLLEVLHGSDLLPASLLHRFIRATGDNPWAKLTHQQIAAGLQLLGSQLDQAERMMGPAGMGLQNPFAGWMPAGRAQAAPPRRPAPAPEPPEEQPPVPADRAPAPADAARGELDELRARLADLERLLKG